MVHSGSRNYGDYILNTIFNGSVPTQGITSDSSIFESYINAHNDALRFSTLNRELIAKRVYHLYKNMNPSAYSRVYIMLSPMRSIREHMVLFTEKVLHHLTLVHLLLQEHVKPLRTLSYQIQSLILIYTLYLMEQVVNGTAVVAKTDLKTDMVKRHLSNRSVLVWFAITKHFITKRHQTLIKT